MKICLCLHHFLPDFVGGTEMYTLRLAQYLQEAGVEMIIIIPHLDHSATTEYIYEGVRVIRYAENSIEDRKMIMGKKKPEGLNEFVSILKKEKPGIVHFHELAPGRGINIFHVEQTYQLHIPVVLTFHVSYYTCLKGSMVYKDEKKCDGLIIVSRCMECMYASKNITGLNATLLGNAAMALFKLNVDATLLNNTVGTALGLPSVVNKLKNDLAKLSGFAEKIVVLAEWYKDILQKNGIPSSKLIYIKQGLINSPGASSHKTGISAPLKVIYIGRISKLKGVHLLIDAVCQLTEEKISLEIYGPETEINYAIECKEKTNGKKNIHWKGTVPSQEVNKILSQSHVLCLPSDFEMSPLVIQEAFAAGIPVLASDVYGNAEQIRDGKDGWLFRFRDSNDLAEKLKCLAEDMNLIETAMQQLPSATGFREVADTHLELYSEILRTKKSTLPENIIS